MIRKIKLNNIDKKIELKNYLIPYIKEIPELLNLFHDNCNHSGRDSTLYKLKKN